MKYYRTPPSNLDLQNASSSFATRGLDNDGFVSMSMWEIFALTADRRDSSWCIYGHSNEVIDIPTELRDYFNINEDWVSGEPGAIPSYLIRNWALSMKASFKVDIVVLDAMTKHLTNRSWDEQDGELCWNTIRDETSKWGFIAPLSQTYSAEWDIDSWESYAVRLDDDQKPYGVLFNRRADWNRLLRTYMSEADLLANDGRKWQKCNYCKAYSKPRTDMIPFKYLSKMNGRSRSICSDCVALIPFINDYLYQNMAVEFGRQYTELLVRYHRMDLAQTVEGTKYIIDLMNFNYDNVNLLDVHDLFIDNPTTDADRKYNRYHQKLCDILESRRITNVYEIVLPSHWVGSRSQFNLNVNPYNYMPPIFLHGAYRVPRSSHLYYSRYVGDIQNPEDWVQEYGPFYGLEIEVKVRDDREDWRDVSTVQEEAVVLFHPENYPDGFIQDGPTQLILQKRDGSLGRNSTEYVTQPLSYDYWINHVPERFWDYFRANFMGRLMDDYGIHIHIGYDAMDIPHRWMFLELLDNMMLKPDGVLRAVAGRGSNDSYARWQPLVFRGARHRAFEVARQKQQTGQNSKYWAVNTKHENTLELRMFQSNTGKNSILGMIQFVQNLWTFSKSLTDDVNWDFEDEDQSPPQMLLDRIQVIRGNADNVFMNWVQRGNNTDANYLLSRLAGYEVVEERYNILERE